MDDAERRSTVEQEEGSGVRGRAPEPRFLAVGEVVGAHGVRGEIKVTILSDDPERFARLEHVYFGPDEENPEPHRVESARLHGGQVLLKIEGWDDRDTAKALRGTVIMVPLEQAIPLEEGEYFEHQIVGLEVRTGDGELVGKVVEVLYTRANEVYVIKSAETRQEILIPAIAEVVREVDLEGGKIIVDLMEGLV